MIKAARRYEPSRGTFRLYGSNYANRGDHALAAGLRLSDAGAPDLVRAACEGAAVADLRKGLLVSIDIKRSKIGLAPRSEAGNT